jgi:hypothetical protein
MLAGAPLSSFGLIVYDDPDSFQGQFRFDLIVEVFVVLQNGIDYIALIPQANREEGLSRVLLDWTCESAP